MTATEGTHPLAIGVLAIQGAFREQLVVLSQLGCEAIEVRTAAALEQLDGLIIPGGESTTMRRVMARTRLYTELGRRLAGGLPCLGTCAGMIVLARADDDGAPASLGVLDVRVDRNAFGRQVASFEAPIAHRGSWCAVAAGPSDGVFIRAPRIREIGRDVEVIGELADGEPVAVRQGTLVGASFHPELTPDLSLHKMFIESCIGKGNPRVRA